ncbi:hypothetical protein DUNSADRAFT_3358 [Dunaliella salina]|uniref:Uncharacterized protein n=1 Tax=Dunaliella salina TaxID=3046 RepID=A0ABQ7FVU7_DUNSA|nr:hypothetical protein DUNSADRAFT_3358 [Dunaliella salina]|eukprot:KAF5826376.1 hypothetical protein DUNSADRAFT_3358 [Dunaliella salina]
MYNLKSNGSCALAVLHAYPFKCCIFVLHYKLQQHSGDTPLIIACLEGHLPIVRLLCERGANLNAADNDGVTALEWANKNGHSAVASYMMEQQAARSAARPAASPPAPKSSTGASAARPAASPSATKSSTGASAQRKIDVFVSFRVKEAEPEAIALKRALEAENLSVFCSSVDIPRGSDWYEEHKNLL